MTQLENQLNASFFFIGRWPPLHENIYYYIGLWNMNRFIPQKLQN